MTFLPYSCTHSKRSCVCCADLHECWVFLPAAIKFMTYEQLSRKISHYLIDQGGDGQLTPVMRLLAGAGACRGKQQDWFAGQGLQLNPYQPATTRRSNAELCNMLASPHMQWFWRLNGLVAGICASCLQVRASSA